MISSSASLLRNFMRYGLQLRKLSVSSYHLTTPSWTTSHFSTSSSMTNNEDTTISRDTLERLAQLVKLSIREEDAPKLCKDLESVLKYVERIQGLETTNVTPMLSPTFDLLQQTPLREDVPELTSIEVLANAKERSGPFLVVPKIKS